MLVKPIPPTSCFLIRMQLGKEVYFVARFGRKLINGWNHVCLPWIININDPSYIYVSNVNVYRRMQEYTKFKQKSRLLSYEYRDDNIILTLIIK